MWFYLGCQNFIAKKNLANDFCEIFISDFIHIWHRSLSNNELTAISQSLNPLIEASVQKFRDLILNLLEDVRAEKSVWEENNNITLKLESNFHGLKFRFQILLNEASSEKFFKEFTHPFLVLLKGALNREKKLIKIIEDKDEELAEYKKEWGNIKSSFMATKPFIKKEFYNHESESIPWDLCPFLDDLKFLSADKLDEVEGQSKLKKEDEECLKRKKCTRAQPVSIKKSITKEIGSKPCVILDNQILKKKQKKALKLNF